MISAVKSFRVLRNATFFSRNALFFSAMKPYVPLHKHQSSSFMTNVPKYSMYTQPIHKNVIKSSYDGPGFYV
jgi:hypothetical protein